MALTIGIEIKGVIANADASPDTAMAGSLWDEDGSGTDSFTIATFLYGNNCFAGLYSNKAGYQYYDIGAANVLDFTPGTGAQKDQFIWMWVNCRILGVLATKANKGLAIRIGTDLSNYREYCIGGSDDSNKWLGGWKCFVIDPTKASTTGMGLGSLNLASVRYFGVYINNVALEAGDSIFIDQISVGKGLRVTGTSTTGWLDIVNYCTAYASRAWGMFTTQEGIFFTQGRTFIGNTAQTSATSFVTAGRIIQWVKTEYWSGSAWVTLYPSTINGITVEDSTNFATTFQDGTLVGSDSGSLGSQFIGDPNSTISMTLYTGNNVGSVTKLYGSTLKDIKGTIILGDNTSNQYFSDTFLGCGAMTLGTSNVQNSLFVSQLGLVTYGGGIVKNCSFISSTVSPALLWNQAVSTDGKLDGTSFASSGTGHAIELGPNCPSSIVFKNMAFTGYGSAETTNAAIYNNSGKAIAISLIGTDEPTVKNGDGASTTFPTSVTLTIAVKDIDGDPMVGVRCYIDDNNQTPFILDDVTDDYGEASVVHTAGAVSNATWRVRKYGYIPFQQLVSIGSEDITLPVTLVDDPIY